MKLTTLIMTSLVAASANAGLTDGEYAGKGLWKSATETGRYEVTTAIHGDKVNGSYILPGGAKKEWNFAMNQKANGFFDVKSEGAVVGKGYCLEKVDVCHYWVAVGKMTLEETLVVENKNLYRFGSKDD